MNIQPIEKRRVSDGSQLEVHSVFNTIQGEGPYTGHRAVFIRLAGCNLQCPLCDTDYTVERWNSTPFALTQLVRQHSEPGTLVVITGGEPFRQNIEPLVTYLIDYGYSVQIETNGTLPPPSVGFASLCTTDPLEKNKCFIVCSPKTGKVNDQLKHLIGAYKYVASASDLGFDGLPLHPLGHSSAPWVARPHEGFGGPVYLQPCDSKSQSANDANLEACIGSVMRNNYILQLQIHKAIGAE